MTFYFWVASYANDFSARLQNSFINNTKDVCGQGEKIIGGTEISLEQPMYSLPGILKQIMYTLTGIYPWVFKNCSGYEKCFLPRILKAVKWYTMNNLNLVKDHVLNPRLTLLIGPQFSFDPSADDPDKESQDKLPAHEETSSSE